MNHEEFELLAARHHEGLATEDELRQMDEHVRLCPECLADIAESEAAPEVPMRETTFQAIRRRPFFRWWLGAAALFFLALFGWSELRLRVEREDSLQLQANLDRLRTENVHLFRSGLRSTSAAEVIAGPDTRIVTLANPAQPAASARVFLDPESRRGYVFLHGLASNRYRLLAVAHDDSPPQSLAAFRVKPSGDAAVAFQDFPDLQKTSRLVVTIDHDASSRAAIDTPILSGTF